jgi:long-chain acyl-CoA synthetase
VTGDGAVLLTGATGFVGMELLARWVERTDRDVYVLVRAADDSEAELRLRSTMETLYGSADTRFRGQVTAVAADIERDGLGMPEARRDWLAARVSDIVHSAASVSFSLPLDESREINVGGTRRLLEFARSAQACGGLTRFAYVSTAYVAGTHEGSFFENQLDVGQDFRNAYERSKFEAETLVREEADRLPRLPLQVFRPSIIVGERGSGWTASFNVLYAPLKAFARGALRVLPARRSSPVDVVPVDYVADAIFALASAPLDGDASPETYQLVAGREATTVGRLASLGAREFGRRPPRVVSPGLYRRLVHPLLLRTLGERQRRALARSEVFFPYFTMRVAFDDSRARARLGRMGIRVSSVERYLDRLIGFAKRADWGRRPVSRRAASGRGG